MIFVSQNHLTKTTQWEPPGRSFVNNHGGSSVSEVGADMCCSDELSLSDVCGRVLLCKQKRVDLSRAHYLSLSLSLSPPLVRYLAAISLSLFSLFSRHDLSLSLSLFSRTRALLLSLSLSLSLSLRAVRVCVCSCGERESVCACVLVESE